MPPSTTMVSYRLSSASSLSAFNCCSNASHRCVTPPSMPDSKSSNVIKFLEASFLVKNEIVVRTSVMSTAADALAFGPISGMCNVCSSITISSKSRRVYFMQCCMGINGIDISLRVICFTISGGNSVNSSLSILARYMKPFMLCSTRNGKHIAAPNTADGRCKWDDFFFLLRNVTLFLGFLTFMVWLRNVFVCVCVCVCAYWDCAAAADDNDDDDDGAQEMQRSINE
mmetsp:Transcript_24784/g.69593  ORF Transcript_24784/g.69593 Transcript_24784/m.69593 type:complete len:227 (-) Transcript_24784:67-747(-)